MVFISLGNPLAVGAFAGGLFGAAGGLWGAALVDSLGEGQLSLHELGQGHCGEGVPRFGIDRHPHACVGVAEFVGPRVAESPLTPALAPTVEPDPKAVPMVGK